LTPVLAPPVLGIVGFGAAGPVACQFPPQSEVAFNPSELLGSIAAGIQAGIGNIAAVSAFAVAQSIGMGGAVPTIITAIAAAIGASVGGGAGGGGGAGPDGEDPKEDDLD